MKSRFEFEMAILWPPTIATQMRHKITAITVMVDPIDVNDSARRSLSHAIGRTATIANDVRNQRLLRIMLVSPPHQKGRGSIRPCKRRLGSPSCRTTHFTRRRREPTEGGTRILQNGRSQHPNPRADLTEDYHSLVKSHTAAIEQLLEDFNDDQMMFCLEAEAYEREQLAAIQASPPTTTEQNEEPPIEDITDAGQEERDPAEGPPKHAHTVPEPVEVEVSPREPTPPPIAPESIAPEDCSAKDITPLVPTTQPPAPTPQLDHPATTPDPETILNILEEE